MYKKNIVIAGFPKSGTTWASCLIAELIQCPLIGDWGYNNDNCPYKEGLYRHSQFQCYKSHHTFDELKLASPSPIHKIIYIIRDPRDIAISGVYYFNFSLPYVVEFITKIRLPKLEGPVVKVINRLLTKRQKKKRLIKAILYGDKKINYWLKTSWQEHYKDYLNNQILCIKYENLLNTPKAECTKIMNHLGLETTIEHIEKSINNQSFKRKKKISLSQDNPSLKKLTRKGVAGSWKKELNQKEKAIFHKKLNNSCNLYEF